MRKKFPCWFWWLFVRSWHEQRRVVKLRQLTGSERGAARSGGAPRCTLAHEASVSYPPFLMDAIEAIWDHARRSGLAPAPARYAAAAAPPPLLVAASGCGTYVLLASGCYLCRLPLMPDSGALMNFQILLFSPV